MCVTRNVIKSIPVTGNSIPFTESPLTERKSVTDSGLESIRGHKLHPLSDQLSDWFIPSAGIGDGGRLSDWFAQTHCREVAMRAHMLLVSATVVGYFHMDAGAAAVVLMETRQQFCHSVSL